MYIITKRLFDFFLSLILAVLFSPIYFFLWIILKINNDAGPVIHWSKRVGKDEKIFLMPKFRTMRIDTPQVATHLLTSADSYLTSMGSFLRKSSLDELPQLWSILIGKMSFVGPRPALFNQDDLLALRRVEGIDKLTPGLTGWAQINGRDDLPVKIKVQFEKEYLLEKSFFHDLEIMWLTFFKVIGQDNVQH